MPKKLVVGSGTIWYGSVMFVSVSIKEMSFQFLTQTSDEIFLSNDVCNANGETAWKCCTQGLIFKYNHDEMILILMAPRRLATCYRGPRIFILGYELKSHKPRERELFKAGRRPRSSIVIISTALEKFRSKMGTHGPQRDCYVALLSNMSLIHYKKGVNPSIDTKSYAEVDGPD